MDDVVKVSLHSRSYFCNIFRSITNKSFTEYLNELRISKAKELLKNTDMKVIGICSQTGFENVTHEPKSVVASEYNGNVVTTVKYDKYQVIMNFIPGSEVYHAVVFGEKGTMVREIDISICYKLGFEKFVEMLKTKKLPIALERLYACVSLMNSVKESYTTGKEVLFNSF